MDGRRASPKTKLIPPKPGYSLAPTPVLGQARKRENVQTLFSVTLFPHRACQQTAYSNAAVMAYNQQFRNDDYYNNNNWDSRSAKSYNTQHSSYSTQHLNSYNNAPPVPQMPYVQPVIDYPPMQPPQPRYGDPYNRAASIASGFSSARDKLMKRRVSTGCNCLLLFRRTTPRLPAPSLLLLDSNQIHRC